MTPPRLLLLAATLTGCTATNTFSVVAPVTVSAPVTIEAAAQVAIASTTIGVAPTSPSPPVMPPPPPTPAPTATPAPTPEPTPTPAPRSGGGGGGGGGRVAPPPPPPPPPPTPTPRPLAYAPSAPEGAGPVDVSYLVTGDSSLSSGGGTSYAQTFKATRTGQLTALALYVEAGGPIFNIAIQAVDAQRRPVGPDLGTVELFGHQMWRPVSPYNPDDVWPSVTPAIVRFDPPVPVVAGTTYAWVATPTQGSLHPKWVGTKADGYADGAAYIRAETTWRLPLEQGATLAPQDYNFETFVQDAVASPAGSEPLPG